MTSLAFRNVDASPDDPVSTWPIEAIQTALERGGLSDWRRLAKEIRAQPWGAVTRQVESVLDYSHPYGVGKAMEGVIALACGVRVPDRNFSVATLHLRHWKGHTLRHADGPHACGRGRGLVEDYEEASVNGFRFFAAFDRFPRVDEGLRSSRTNRYRSLTSIELDQDVFAGF
jgi:hypothetical protein